MKWFFLFCFLMFPALAVGSDEIDRAREALDSGRAEESVAVLTDLLQKEPHRVEARSLRALALGSLGEEDRAIGDYEKVIEARSDDANAHYQLGMLLAFRKKEARHALEHLDRYLSLENDAAKARAVVRVMKSLDPIFTSDIEKRSLDAMQAQLDETTGNDRKKTLENILKWNPNSAEALALVSRALWRDGTASRAENLCRRAIEIHPTFGACHEILAQILEAKGRTGEARKHRNKADWFAAQN